MSVSFVGAQGAAATTVTIPTHQVGDLILLFAYRDGSNTAPTTPTAGGTVPTWNLIGSSGANTNSSNFRWAVATATNTTSGTWTGATELICLVYRGASVGASASAGTNSSTITYPALTLQRTDGSSWVVGVAGHRTATNVELAPTGMTNRAFSGTEAAGHDTGGTVTSWSQQTVTVNAASGHRSWTVELKNTTVTLLADVGTFAVTGVNADVIKAAPKLLTADSGTLSASGINANLVHSLRLLADKGTFTLTGNAAGLRISRQLIATRGIFAFVGVSVLFTRNRHVTASAGSILTNGTTANWVKSRVVLSQAGAFSVTCNPASVTATQTLVASNRSFTVTGNAANLVPSYKLLAATRTVTINGINANLNYVPAVSFDTGAFTINAGPTQLIVRRTLTSDRRIIIISGQSTPITKGHQFVADSYNESITGQSALIRHTAKLNTITRTYHINVGGPPNIDITRLLTVNTYSTVIVGKNANLFTANNQSLVTETGTIIITTVQADWSKKYRLSASKGMVIITKNPAILTSTGTPQITYITSVFAGDGEIEIPVGLRTSIPWWEGDYQEFSKRLPLRINIGRTFGDE
jgi:hypothetical protein